MFLGIHKDPAPKLRKKYDRLREKVDKMKDRTLKLEFLRFLDQLEPTLIALEEQEQPRFERRRMVNYVADGLLDVEEGIKSKK